MASFHIRLMENTIMAANDFPIALRYNVLQFSANVLLHLRSREDTNMGTTGEQLLPMLSKFRSIHPQYVDEFYELVTGICTHLQKYSQLAESCTKSGAYTSRREACLGTIKSMIDQLETQTDVMKMLGNMMRRSAE